MKWELVRLGDVITTKKGFAFKSNLYVDSGIPIVRVSNFTGRSISDDDLKYYPTNVYKIYLDYVIHENDIIIQTVGSWQNNPDSVVGKVVRVPYYLDGALLNQNAVKLSPIENFDNNYLFYRLCCKDFQGHVIGEARGAANQASITLNTIKTFVFYAPCLCRQQRISSFLNAYDKLIENNQKQIKLLEEAAQRLYKEWFIDLRFPGHETTPIVNGNPEGWIEKRFNELFSFVRGKSYTSKELSDTDGVLMINLKSIRPFGGFRRNQEKHYIGKYNAGQKLESGDIIMGVTDMTKERRLVGHVALVPDLHEKATFSMDLIKLTPFSLPKSYLYSVLHFGGLSTQISQLANGVNVLHLKPEAMMNMSMICPTDKIISAYDKMFETIQYRIEALQKECDLAVEARDRLLPKLMNGEIEV